MKLFMSRAGRVLPTRQMSTFHHRYLNKSKDIAIVSVPFSGGQPRKGVELGPQTLRDAGLLSDIEALGWNTSDTGDILISAQEDGSGDAFERVKNPLAVGEMSQRLSDRVAEMSAEGKMVLTLGGDHSLAVGSVSGIQRTHPEVGIIWVDAHADINCPQTTNSGNLHGMPLSILLGLSDPVPGFEWLDMKNPPLKRDQIVYIGLRDLDQGEKNYLRQQKIHAFSMADVDRHGINGVMNMAMKILGDCPIHVSFDIDALDPREAPATGTPVRGGLTFREGCYVMEYLYEQEVLVSMDLVEVNPKLSDAAGVNYTAEAALSVIRSGLGSDLLNHKALSRP